jgi:hypothetical protein
MTGNGLQKLKHGLAVALVASLLASSIGCLGRVRQAAQRAKESNELMQLGLLYHNYYDSTNKWPATVDEFVKFAQANDPATGPVISALQSGKYILYMDVDVAKLPAGSGNTVLAYEADVPAAGGPVLMADGSIRQMTAAEFSAATKPPNAKPSKP